jgi:CBS domain-containing protein
MAERSSGAAGWAKGLSFLTDRPRKLQSMSNELDTIPTSGGAAPVSLFATDAVVTLPPDVTVQTVADELAGDQIGLVILGSLHDVEGVVSERDVVRAVAEGLDPVDTPARAVASTKLVWCDESATVCEVAEQMMEQYVRHVLLEADGQLVGIVSARDLLGAFAISAHIA